MTAELDVSGSNATPHGSEAGTRPPSTPGDVNIALRCVLKGATQRFARCFDDEEDPFHDTIENLMNERDENSKSPLDMGAILGRNDMLKELLSRGAEVNSVQEKGYSCLHHAAAWGRLDAIKLFFSHGGDLQQKTTHGERPRETALRYGHTECVDYLDWAEAKYALQTAVNVFQDILADNEKLQGRLTRDEKNTGLNICKEKSDWLAATTEATTQDYINQKQMFDDASAPLLQKINEPPPEKPEKK